MENQKNLMATPATKIMRAVQLILLTIVLGTLPACAPHYVAAVPDAPVEVRPAVPYAGAVWIDGGWAWSGGRHTWVPGYWSAPRHGRIYRAGEWRTGPRGHYYVRGRWR